MKRPDIHRLLELQMFLEQFSQVERVNHRRHHGKYVQENDTEHSYNLAMTAWFLSPYFPHLDSNLLIRLALVHDLIEVHAGDTNVYADADILATKHEREAAAFKQLQKDWSDFPELLQCIESYESRNSEEAKFVYALDKMMPPMMIYIGEGHTWRQEGITPERIDSVKRAKVAMSSEIAPYYAELYDLLIANAHLFS